MNLDKSQITKLVGGALIGAFLGAAVAWLLMQAPDGLEEGEEPESISAAELLTLTGAAATLIRRLDSLRRKM